MLLTLLLYSLQKGMNEVICDGYGSEQANHTHQSIAQATTTKCFFWGFFEDFLNF